MSQYTYCVVLHTLFLLMMIHFVSQYKCEVLRSEWPMLRARGAHVKITQFFVLHHRSVVRPRTKSDSRILILSKNITPRRLHFPTTMLCFCQKRSPVFMLKMIGPSQGQKHAIVAGIFSNHCTFFIVGAPRAAASGPGTCEIRLRSLKSKKRLDTPSGSAPG